MQKIIVLLLMCWASQAFAQKDTDKMLQPIIEEGHRLYKLEMASWHGTDLFMEQYKQHENIGGYISYINNQVPTCVFYNKVDAPKVIGAITFDTSYDTQKAQVDLTERDLTSDETDLFVMRQKVKQVLVTDTLFKFYKNSRPNIIPLIHNGEKKVYVLTGPSKKGVVIFGNDYLITFDKDNNIVSKKSLHKNIMPIAYEEGKEAVTMHSHTEETGDLPNATDICTLLLYGKISGWTQHNIVSKKYLTIWNCKTGEIDLVMTTKALKKIQKHQEKLKKERK